MVHLVSFDESLYVSCIFVLILTKTCYLLIFQQRFWWHMNWDCIWSPYQYTLAQSAVAFLFTHNHDQHHKQNKHRDQQAKIF